MKKKIINLEDKNITFEYNNTKVKALIFNSDNRTIEVLYIKENKKEKIAFIHIPKNIKKIISPLK